MTTSDEIYLFVLHLAILSLLFPSMCVSCVPRVWSCELHSIAIHYSSSPSMSHCVLSLSPSLVPLFPPHPLYVCVPVFNLYLSRQSHQLCCVLLIPSQQVAKSLFTDAHLSIFFSLYSIPFSLLMSLMISQLYFAPAVAPSLVFLSSHCYSSICCLLLLD